jgi:Double-stranded DNA-binding domain
VFVLFINHSELLSENAGDGISSFCGNSRPEIMQEDSELAAIRAARLSQLQQNAGNGSNEGETEQRASATAAAEEQMRRDLLATVLDVPARERRTWL